MADAEMKALQAKERAQIAGKAEGTRPGLVFTPAVDIFETEKELTLLADMPGVKANDLTIDLRENVLTIDGEVKFSEVADEEIVFQEYGTGKYSRQFTLTEMIDQSKIDAELKDGVLRLTLPKAEAAKPRKLEVRSS